MLRVLIVEDEPEVAGNLRALIQRYGEKNGQDFDITWVSSALEMFGDKRRYDICLLDIDLPGINGMEAAHLLRSYNHSTVIIFVTNLAKYAVSGYEVGALGFIVKPATFATLSMNLDRALRHLNYGAHRTVVVPSEDDLHMLPFDEITYIEVINHDLVYHLADREPLTARGSLRQVEEQLEGAPTLRISRGIIANMDMVASVRGNDVVMATGERLHIPRGRKREITETLTSYLGVDR